MPGWAWCLRTGGQDAPHPCSAGPVLTEVRRSVSWGICFAGTEEPPEPEEMGAGEELKSTSESFDKMLFPTPLVRGVPLASSAVGWTEETQTVLSSDPGLPLRTRGTVGKLRHLAEPCLPLL